MAGLVDQVIPSYRLPAEVVARDLYYINSLNLNFLPNRNIDSSEFNRIRSRYDAVFLGTGMSALQKADFPGKSAKGVVDALDFLQRARAGKMVIDSQQTFVVVGGGNVALDAAVVAKRSGAGEVIVLYRRSRDEMPGWEPEYLEATRLGVEFRWLSTLAVIEQTDGKVRSVQVQKMHFTNEIRGGRRWAEADPLQSLSGIPCQVVILALGQTAERDWLDGLGLQLTLDGFPLVDVGTGQTSLPMVYAGGELVSGGATIVDSLQQGMLAGERIHVLLSGEGG
jgi:NADPH-dependent glutamate synthase beta subunit-like oxidoreductase